MRAWWGEQNYYENKKEKQEKNALSKSSIIGQYGLFWKPEEQK